MKAAAHISSGCGQLSHHALDFRIDAVFLSLNFFKGLFNLVLGRFKVFHPLRTVVTLNVELLLVGFKRIKLLDLLSTAVFQLLLGLGNLLRQGAQLFKQLLLIGRDL